MQVERIFNYEGKLTFEEILLTLVHDKIDSLVHEYYPNDRVNTVASHDEGKIAA
ncbi:hypothetical protein [Paenibacillus tyrfis]|uniref:hypothetical protein n=1 Tax=Paenibacillus tyrfis TaxID=1501230 RepID=UPI000A581CEB|nr:hypothetical protein [Paenibacillus tyrfis]